MRYSFRGYGCKRRGFSFLEIMLVVAIIGIMLAVIGPSLVGRTQKAKISTTRLQIKNIASSLGLYEMAQGEFPTTEQGLEALVTRPSNVSEETWSRYMDDVPLDSWNREFRYVCPGNDGRDFDLISAGPDGQFDTDDDITHHRKDRSR